MRVIDPVYCIMLILGIIVSCMFYFFWILMSLMSGTGLLSYKALNIQKGLSKYLINKL